MDTTEAMLPGRKVQCFGNSYLRLFSGRSKMLPVVFSVIIHYEAAMVQNCLMLSCLTQEQAQSCAVVYVIMNI